jgi:DNA ligase N terminus
VTVEEIHQSLLRIAAFDERSSPEVQSLASSWKYSNGVEILINLYQRLQAREAKWLTRLILKSYAPVKFPANLEPGPQHSFLPTCVQLKIQFSSSAPAPVRRDGTRVIVGDAAKEPSIYRSTPSRAAPQSLPSPPVRIAASTQIASTHAASSPNLPSLVVASSIHLPSQAFMTPLSSVSVLSLATGALQTASAPTSSISQVQSSVCTPPSSLPVPTAIIQSKHCSSSASTPSARQVARDWPHSHRSTPSRTALGPLSQNIPTSISQKSPVGSSPGPSILAGGAGTCKWTAHVCPLSKYLFILGPLISKDPYISEELLGWHGCRYTSSLRALTHPSFQSRCSRTGKSSNKIALVETREKEITVDFLKRIRQLNLTRKGKREWIEVYDWRLLEYIAKIEQGKKYSYDPWARCWMCRV